MEETNGLHLDALEFKKVLNEVVDLVCDFLEKIDEFPTFPQKAGTFEAGKLPQKGLRGESLKKLRDILLDARVHNGRFFGYVQGNGEPISALGDFFASIINQNMTAWRASPSCITIERTLVDWLGEMIGCKGLFSGTLTGGGSIATLMALGMARESKLATCNDQGLKEFGQGIIYASEEVHMSVVKAVALIGIGTKNLRRIKCDENLRMVSEDLERAITLDVQSGNIPIAVVASAGTVATGAIDPLVEIGKICQKFNIWLHVDGAYGALAAIAAPEKFAGLNLADSISMDPHKWLYQPLDIGCLLYKDRNCARKAFCNSGNYTAPLSNDQFRDLLILRNQWNFLVVVGD